MDYMINEYLIDASFDKAALNKMLLYACAVACYRVVAYIHKEPRLLSSSSFCGVVRWKGTQDDTQRTHRDIYQLSREIECSAGCKYC